MPFFNVVGAIRAFRVQKAKRVATLKIFFKAAKIRGETQ
jgi:hypothetical protein